MKQLIVFPILFFGVLMAWAQNQELKPIAQEIAARVSTNEAFAESGDLFKLASTSKRMAAAAQIENASVLELQPAALQRLMTEDPSNLRMTIPSNAGSMVLRLYEVNPFSEGFYVTTSDGQQFAPEGKHYRGIVDGDNESLVAISIFKDEVMGLVVDNAGNTVLGKIGETENDYVLYNDRNLKDFQPPVCQTTDEYLRAPVEDLPETDGRAAATSCVRAYWEADYELYQNKGSVANVVNYLTGLFNQSKIIYDNDGISVTLQQIYVWNTPSPYSGDTGSKLGQFRSYRTSFNGDLAHLIHADGGGGVAYVNALCASGWNYGVSNISTSYANYPTYSWSVMVVTHEQGHIMGSQHTHDCVWNGNNTAIDHCGGNSCWATEDSPSGGGTVMSYCHLTNAGINLTKGFGPQPKARITNAINSKGCLSGTCGGDDGGGSGSYVQLHNRGTGLILDGMGRTDNGAACGQYGGTNHQNSHWEMIDVGSGYVQFQNRGTGMILDGMGRTNNGADAGQWAGTNHQNSHWAVQQYDGNYYRIQNRATGLYLDGMGRTNNGANCGQYGGTTHVNAQWQLVNISGSSGTGALTDEVMEADAIVENLITDVVVYPNPSENGNFIIEVPETLTDARLTIFNLSGKEFFTMQLNGAGILPVKAGLRPGMYVVRVIRNGDTEVEKKLLVK